MTLDPVVAGLGWRSSTDPAEIIALMLACLAEADRKPADLRSVVTIDRKASDPVLAAVADHFSAAVNLVSAAELAELGIAGSPRVTAAIGVGSVAEAGASRFGALILPRRQSARATCALAQASAESAAATLVTSGAGR